MAPTQHADALATVHLTISSVVRAMAVFEFPRACHLVLKIPLLCKEKEKSKEKVFLGKVRAVDIPRWLLSDYSLRQVATGANGAPGADESRESIRRASGLELATRAHNKSHKDKTSLLSIPH